MCPPAPDRRGNRDPSPLEPGQSTPQPVPTALPYPPRPRAPMAEGTAPASGLPHPIVGGVLMYGALRLRPARCRCHFGRRRWWEEGGCLWLLPPFCRWRLSAEGAGGGCRSQTHTPRHPLASPTGDLATVCFGERGWPWLEGREGGAGGRRLGRPAP